MSDGGRVWTFETKVIAAVGGLIFLLWLAKPDDPSRDRGFLQAPTTFSSSDGGARALSLVLEELGLDPLPRMRPWGGAPDPECLVVLAPREPILPSEAAWCRSWIERGGRLVFAPPEGEAAAPLSERLGLGKASPIAGGIARRADDASLSEEARRILGATPRSLAGFRRFLEPPKDEAAAGRVEVLAGAGEGAAAVLLLTIGDGRALVLSDAAPLTNERLQAGGAATFVARAIAWFAGPLPVWFDEFHHGYDERAGITQALSRFLRETPAGWASAQLVLLGIAATVFAGVRLGAPLSPPAPARRSSIEHVDALAAAYRSARAARRPAALLVEGLKLRLRAESAGELGRRLEGIARDDAARRADVDLVVAQRRDPGNPADLVKLSRAVDRILASEKARAASR